MRFTLLNKLISSLVLVGLVAGQKAEDQSPVDVVFIIDETGSMNPEHQKVLDRTQEIFNELKLMTCGNVSHSFEPVVLMSLDILILTHFQFRVGLVGFGRSGDNGGQLITPLTNSEKDFRAGLDLLKIDGAYERGYTATARVAYDDYVNLGGHMDGGDGSTFPAARGFCPFLFTDDSSNTDNSLYNSVEEVQQALKIAGNSSFYGVVPSSQVAATYNRYGKLAEITGGIVQEVQQFLSDDTVASESASVK